MAGKHQYKISNKQTRRKANRKWRHQVQKQLQTWQTATGTRKQTGVSQRKADLPRTTLVYRAHDEQKGNDK